MDLLELEKKYQTASTTDERFALSEQYRIYLEEQLRKNPYDIQALIHLGVLSWEPFHEYQKAIEYLKRAIDLDPKNTDARFWLATCYYHDYCEYEKAKQIALEALNIDPTRADCLCLLAMINWDYHKDLKAAIQYLEKAVHYAPDWPMLRHLLITLFLELKDIKSTEFHLQKAFELSNIPPIKPRHNIDKYYENVFTGRGWPNKRKEFQELIKRFQNAKSMLDKISRYS